MAQNNCSTGSVYRHRLGGCIPSNRPSDQPKFGSIRKYDDKHLPASVDLRPLMTPVEDQGNTCSCVGNALAAAYEFLIMKNSKKHVDVSRLFIYYNSRLIDGLYEYNMEDKGTLIENAVKALGQYGCCKESTLPYDTTRVNRKPTSKCYDEAQHYRIEKAMQVVPTLSEMKACLAQGYPFVFGLETFESFHKTGKDGKVHVPNINFERQNGVHGWHAMLAAGYSDKLGCFIVKNSWGENWGDKGYAYIPYEYMSNKRHCQDLHTIQVITNQDREQNQFEIEKIPESLWHMIEPHMPFDLYKFRQMIFDDQWFWRDRDPIELINSHWPFKNLKNPFSSQNKSRALHILWIDEQTDENMNVVDQLKKESNIVRIDFCQDPSAAEKYILNNMEEINYNLSDGYFKIICRGFYRLANRTSIDLLKFLDRQQLKTIPVIVFMRDIQSTEHSLKQQASMMHIYDWKDRVTIIDKSRDLMEQISSKS